MPAGPLQPIGMIPKSSPECGEDFLCAGRKPKRRKRQQRQQRQQRRREQQERQEVQEVQEERKKGRKGAEKKRKRSGKKADRRSRKQTNIPEADKQEKTANGEEGGGRVRDEKQRRREALKNSDVSDATHTSLTPPNRFPIGKVRQNGIGILPRSVFRDKDNKKNQFNDLKVVKN